MAIEKVIDIKVQGNADQAVGSLRSQLRQAQADVAALSDKFGATSAEAVKAAQKAAELKDRIGDAKALTDAFNPDAKFKALTSSLAGVAGGFAAVQGGMALFGNQSKDLEATLLKVQSAMALSQGIQALGESMDSFKQLKAVAINAMQGIKAAIGATGIGLLVIALGTVVAYWDDIKEVVGGVSEEQKKLNEATQKGVEANDKKLTSLNSQDNILKLQGKSEKEILGLKINQTDEAIKAYEINIENIKTTNTAQQEAAARNYEYLKSFLDFVTIPQRYLYESAAKNINQIIDLINKIPGVKITNKIDETFGDKATDYLAKLGFDPAKTRKEGDTVVEEANKTLLKLKNDRAGYQLAINDINKKGAEKSVETEKEKNDRLYKEYLKTLPEIDPANIEAELSAIDAKNQAKRDKNKKFAEDTISDQEQFELQIAALVYDSEAAQDERRKEARDKKIKDFQETTEAVGSIAQSGENLLAAIQANGLARGKAGQTAMKALALVQIAADSAIAFSKMMQGTETVAAGASLGVPPPAAPATYLATKIAFYASGSATILANLARARGLLSGGGGGGGGAVTTPSAGGGGGATAPQFNVVGSTGVNQLAGVMGAQQQTPVQAYVVANNVTTAQGLDRNIIQSATLGG
jgi:hypothetical protein